MKKVVFLVLSAMLAAFMFMGCGNDGGADADTINLTWWKLNDHIDTAGMDQIIASFQETYPHVTVTVAGHSNETLHQNLQISAMNDTLPSMWFQWGGALGGRYVEYGVTRDLTQFAQENNWDQRFTAASLELMTLHGQLAFYPRVMNALVVYYNQDIFADLGLSVPTTMAEFHHVVETIHAAGIIPMNTASVPGWHIMRMWEQFLEHYAGAAQHDQLQIFAVPWEGNQAVINSFATLQRYALSGFFPPGFISMEAADLTILFYPGQAAMVIEGQWMDNNIINDGQDLSRFGYFALPNGGTNRVSAFGEGFQFNDNLTDEEFRMAMAFLDHFHQAHHVEQFPGMYGSPLPLIGATDTMPAHLLNAPSILSTASANGAFTINDQALPPIVVDELFTTMDYVSLGTVTPEEAASRMQRAIERHQAE